jgi:hypothetical protein
MTGIIKSSILVISLILEDQLVIASDRITDNSASKPSLCLAYLAQHYDRILVHALDGDFLTHCPLLFCPEVFTHNGQS